MPRGRRRAEAEIGASSRRLDPDLRKARRKFRLFGRDVKKDMRSVSRAGAGARRALSFLGVGTTAALGLAAADVFKFEKTLTRLQIQAGRTPKQMAAFRDRIDEVARSSGIAREELLDVSQRFVSLTGDMATAEQLLDTFAKTARASGAATGDLARVAFSLQKNFDIMDPAKFEKAFSIILSAGKAGSVELKEMASLLTTIAPQFAKFGTTGADGLAQLSGAFQVVQSGFAGPAEAATGLNSIFTALIKNAGKFKSAGVNIFERNADGTKQLRNFRDIIDDIATSKLATDPTRLIKAFGRNEAVRAFSELAKFRPEWDSIAEAARKADDVAKDSAIYDESAAGKMEKTLAVLKSTMAEVFTPERIQTFAKALERSLKVLELMNDAIDNVGFAWDRITSPSDGHQIQGVGLRESGKRFGFSPGGNPADAAARLAAGDVDERDIRSAREFLREAKRHGIVDERGNVQDGQLRRFVRNNFADPSGAAATLAEKNFRSAFRNARRVAGRETPSEATRRRRTDEVIATPRETGVGEAVGLPPGLQRFPAGGSMIPPPVRVEHTFRFDQDMGAHVETRQNRDARRGGSE